MCWWDMGLDCELTSDWCDSVPEMFVGDLWNIGNALGTKESGENPVDGTPGCGCCRDSDTRVDPGLEILVECSEVTVWEFGDMALTSWLFDLPFPLPSQLFLTCWLRLRLPLLFPL